MAKFRVFVSFDFDKDRQLKDFVLGQAKLPGSPFEVENWSLNEPAPEKTWRQTAEKRIARCNVMVVMVGTHTYRAPGVLTEVKIAIDLKIPVRQIIGYKGTSPTPVPGAGRLYRWNWPNLEKILS